MNKDEIAELIKLLRLEAVACRRAGPSDVADKLNKAANALTTLSAENERLERRNASDRECWRLAAENCAALSARVERLEEYLKKIDVAVSHGKMGDWSIALTEIRKYVAGALGDTDNG